MTVHDRQIVVEKLVGEKLAAYQRLVLEPCNALKMGENDRSRFSTVEQELQDTCKQASSVGRSCTYYQLSALGEIRIRDSPLPNSSRMIRDRDVAPRRAIETWFKSIMNAEAVCESATIRK